jgi:hypothetical protein
MIRISGVIGGWEVDPEEIVYQIYNSVGNLDIEIDSVGGSVIGGKCRLAEAKSPALCARAVIVLFDLLLHFQKHFQTAG